MINKNNPQLPETKRGGYLPLRTLSASLDTSNYTVADSATNHTLDTAAGYVDIVTDQPVYVKIGTGATTSDHDYSLDAGTHSFLVGKDTTAISLIRKGADSANVDIIERAEV